MRIYNLVVLIILNLILKNVQSENLKLLILHNNDMHARFEETSRTSGTCKDKSNCYGGFGRVLHVVREARKAAADGTGPPVLYLNAGDTYTGTSWFSVHKWKIAADFMNLLQPDVASLGNHEFDYGPSGLLPFLKNINFPIVTANLDYSNETEFLQTNISKSIVLEIGGYKIGVIGYLTPQTVFLSHPGKMKFLDEVESIRDESERLNASGVKIIIALGHSGYEMDKMIAREVPLVDLVVGGHSHTFLWNGKEPDLDIPEGRYPTYIQQVGGKTVPVVQAYAFTKYMGRLEVIFNDDGDIVDCHGEPQLLNNTVPVHPDVVQLYPKYRLSWESTVVGKSKVVLDGGSKICRHKECNFGNLVTDSFVYYHASSYEGEYWTDAPIALLNGGTLRNELIPDPHSGNITYSDLLSAIPFVDNIVSVSLNGSTLLQTLEHGLKSNGETSYGEFLQTSGLFYTVDRTKPPGTRIVDAKARCGLCKVPIYENIVPDKIYRILTRKFVSRGGDGYAILKENAFEEVFEDQLMFDIILWYVKRLSPIMIGEEDRILALKKQLD